MKAYQVIENGKPLEERTLERPEPKGREVVLRTVACGTIMLQPVIPGFADKSLRFLKEDNIEWNSINKTLLNCKIDNFEAIVTRIDDNHLDKLMGN